MRFWQQSSPGKMKTKLHNLFLMRQRTGKATEDGRGRWGQEERLCSDERQKESNILICLMIYQQFSKGYQMNVPNRERWIVIRHINVLTTQFDQF